VGKIRKPFAVCFEASTGYGYLFEHLQTIARRVVVAHPGQLRLIFRSKRKNDRVDAEKLAKLLFLDEVPPVYVPSSEVRSWRGFIGHRYKLVRERTRTKNSIRALLGGLARSDLFPPPRSAATADHSGSRTSHVRGGDGLGGRSRPLSAHQERRPLLRPGAQPGCFGPHQSPGSHHT